MQCGVRPWSRLVDWALQSIQLYVKGAVVELCVDVSLLSAMGVNVEVWKGNLRVTWDSWEE